MKAIHKFAKDQLDAIEAVNKKFQDGTKRQDITYNDFRQYPLRKWIEVSPGIQLFFLEYNEKYYVIKCKMKGKLPTDEAVLSEHEHSTHGELFLLIEGYMRDNLDPTIHLTENDTHIYSRGVAHEPVGLNELLIIGYR